MSESVEQARSSPRCSHVQAERAALMVALVVLDWRILAWLVRYPFQRADDLVVGLARWASRATVYRHLHRLEQDGLLAGVLPKTPAEGKRLYHLSNLGLHLLATHLGASARTLAHDWQSDDAGLVRLVPRLPLLLSVQDLINGLVIHAGDALTMQGRRPTLVRWNWQRDLVHHFRFREQALRLFVDGAVALCVETQPREGTHAEHWYGLLVLATDLEDEQVMRVRLERLLCWRECAERWGQYQHMLPVLILAHSPRQRDHWQRAMEQAAQQVRVTPLVGALVVLPNGERPPCNPWQLHWHTLSTGCGCHLSAVLHPLPLTALPPSLRPDDDAPAGIGERWLARPTAAITSAQMPTRLSHIISRKVTGCSVTGIKEASDRPATLAWLAWHVTPGQWQIIRLLLAHPLLTTDQLAVFLHLQRHSVRCSLYALHRLQCIVPVATVVGQCWHLDSLGLQLVAAANRLPLRALATVTDTTATAEVDGALSVVQHGVSWLVQHIQHTAGVYSFFAHLMHATAHHPGQSLCWWETGALCERRYRVNERWYNLRPDALADYAVEQRHIPFWLEWDRDTMNVRDLTVKFTAYAQYLASREWAREQNTLPLLVCVVPDIAQEQRIMRVAQATLTKTSGLALYTTPIPLLKEYGPLAAIWSSVLTQQQPEGRPRQALFAGRTSDYDTSGRGEEA